MFESDKSTGQAPVKSSENARRGEPIVDEIIVAVLYRIGLDVIDETALGAACNQAAEKFATSIWANLKQDSAGCNLCLSHALNNLMTANFVKRIIPSHKLYVTSHATGQCGGVLYRHMLPELQAQIDEVAKNASLPDES